MEIKGTIENIKPFEKNVFIKVAGKQLSCFKNQLENFQKEVREDFKYKMGDQVLVTYVENEVNGKTYLNIKDMSLIQESDEAPEILATSENAEPIGYFPDNKQKNIDLGMCFKMAQKKLDGDTYKSENYDDELKEATRRHLRILKELQDEILV